MIYYFFLLFIAILLAIIENKRLAGQRMTYTVYENPSTTNKMIFVVLFMFFCVSAFRYEMGGSDYEYYEYFYGEIQGQSNYFLCIATSMYEVGYTSYIYLCANILHLSYNGSLVVEAAIFYLLMYLGLRKYVPNWGIFLIFFIYKMFFYVTFVAMRQAFTVAGFFLIMRYLQEGKMIKYYITLLFVSLFHNGAMLLFLLYPLFRLDITKKRLIRMGWIMGLLTPLAGLTAALISFVISILGMSALEDKAAGYSSGEENLSIFYTIEYYLLYILMIKNYDAITAKFKEAKFIIMMFLIVLPIVTLFRSTLILVRELPYFYPAYAILFCYIYVVSKRNYASYFAIFTLLCIAGMIKYMIQFGEGHFLSYHTWLFNPKIHFLQ